MDQYADILNLPHHVSKNRPRMSMIDRGAQFSPFAALTGYEAVIAESERQTQQEITLAEGQEAILDEILRDLLKKIDRQPRACYTCFQPDRKKAGGAYVKIAGRLKKYDSLKRCLILTDGKSIPLDSIISIDTEL